MSIHPTSPRPRALRAIVTGAALCGVGDIVFAFVYYGLKFGAKPPGILRSVAAGVLGKAARDGGATAAALGLFLHFVVAAGIAAVFWFASGWWRALRRRAVASGLVYGGLVYFVMNWVVVPLSAAPSRGYPPQIEWIALFAHGVLVGLPVALAAAHFSKTAAAGAVSPTPPAAANAA